MKQKISYPLTQIILLLRLFPYTVIDIEALIGFQDFMILVLSTKIGKLGIKTLLLKLILRMQEQKMVAFMIILMDQQSLNNPLHSLWSIMYQMVYI